MYYSKTLLVPGAGRYEYDDRFAQRDFNFLHLIDPRNVPLMKYMEKTDFTAELLKSAIDETPVNAPLSGEKGFADFAAAVVTQLAYRSYIDKKRLLRDVTEYIHQILIQDGYLLCAQPQDELRESLQEPGIEIVVAGAQTIAVWKDRVDAAVRLLRDLQFPSGDINITFTGRCPEGGGRILNEAGDMALYFLAEMERLKLPERIKVHRENEAHNTKENLIHSLSRKDRPTPKSHYFFVSSHFHLPRLAKEAHAVLSQTSDAARQITLVSQQPHMNEPEPSSTEATYMKSAMFEFFSRLLEKKIPKMDARPGHG